MKNTNANENKLATLAGVFGLARVLVKLLLEVGLGIDGSTERAHRDFEFPAAKCADRNGGGRTQPLNDSKIALFQRLFFSTIGIRV